jgi:hypothetical protein
MKEGRIVPPELANRVLLRAIEKYAVNGQKTFLVDGFPRSMEQATEFETVCIAFDLLTLTFCFLAIGLPYSDTEPLDLQKPIYTVFRCSERRHAEARLGQAPNRRQVR